MENNLINILMETDPEKLERNTRKEVEIQRLSQTLGTPFMVTVKALPGDRYTELATGNLMSKDGEVDYSNAYKANLLVALEGIVSPDVRDRELQKHFNCATPKDLMEKLFNGGEITKIADAVTVISGYGKDTDNEIKNSSTRIKK